MLKNHIRNIKLYKYEYLLLISGLIVLNIFTNSLNFNADTLFPYRYAESLYSVNDFKIFVQPGPRFFPDVFYAFIARIFTNSESLNFQITIFINSIVLAIALIAFFNNAIKDKPLAILLSTLFLLLIPSTSLFIRNISAYVLLIPGMHGFTATFILICLIYVLKLFDEMKFSVLNFITFSVLVLLVSLNNQLFVPMFILPILGSLVVAKVIYWKNFNFKPFIFVLIILLIAIFLSVKANLIWDLFPDIYVRSNSEYFSLLLFGWFANQGSTLFREFFKLFNSGIFQIIFVVSIITSLLLTTNSSVNYSKTKLSNKLLFLNIMNIITPVIMLIAMWAVNKNLIRYIPNIYVFSTIILLLNWAKSIKHGAQPSRYRTLKITVLAVVMLNILNFYSHPNLLNISIGKKLDNLMVHLKKMKSEGIISDVGLSSYWIAGAGTKQFGFKILPINEFGSPDIHATNLMAFWDKMKPIQFTFIVNRYIPHMRRWSLNKNIIVSNFGNPSRIVQLDKNYEVYLYTNMQTNFMYTELNRKMNKYFTPK